MTTQIDEGLKPYIAIARRLQSISRTDGLAILSIHVVVDHQGIPIVWTEPKCVKLEPKRITKETLLSILSRLE